MGGKAKLSSWNMFKFYAFICSKRQTLLIMTELAASRYYFETQFIFPQSFVSFRHEMLFVWFIVCFRLKVDCNQGGVTSDCFIGNVIVNHK